MKTITLRNRIFLTFVFIFSLSVTFAQVGINTTDPKDGSLLDIDSNNKGVFIPRVNIANLNNIAPVTGIANNATARTAAEGLLVYNTNGSTGPGYFFWSGSEWLSVGDGDGEDDWKRIGNGGTAAGTDFLGTTDSQDLQIRTNNNERMRLLANGQVAVNGAPLFGVDRFTTIGSNNESVLNGYASGANGVGVYGENASTNGIGVLGNVAVGFGLYGLSAGGGISVYGENTASGLGVYGYSEGNNATGIRGDNNGSSDGVYGQNTGIGNGVFGISNNDSGFGMRAVNLGNAGTGLIAAGNNILPTVITSGTGIAASANNGAFAHGKTGTGTGLIGTGNNSNMIVTNLNGGGIAGSGTRNGVFGYAGNGNDVAANEGNAAGVFLLDTDNDITNGGANSIRASAVLAGYDNLNPGGTTPPTGSADHVYFGGYFSGGNEGIIATPTYAYVGLRYNPNGNGGSNGATIDYKIVGTGNVSTLVKDANNTPRVLFAPEAPEVVFQDYGVGQLQNGQAQIKLDPILQKAIFVDSQNPLKVFVTLEGDCNGVYVTNKSSEGFTVKELQGGTSSVPFSWQIVASRADTKDANGKIVSKHVGVRFPKGPSQLTPKAKQHLTQTKNATDSLKETAKNLNFTQQKKPAIRENNKSKSEITEKTE
ncbi:hypothetical protein [Marixanthomonas ophiurae]|uniref:T9SS C-terminal target domain-containing protein n=1 Tax=Marixanthomonas ophiurae TaxID=387659 RepID=A0A3E1Q9E1_9FLAO|nr:hypothetical protein [Marixanthomonas ophiurae]RFN58757.1 hypothetical protein DZ858_01355 [Marixanthomonas ophiurae]